MTKLLIAALVVATLGSSAQAAVSPQDRSWIEKMNFAVDDALSQSNEAPSKAGVVYVPMIIDARGHAMAMAPAQTCGCPDLDQAAVDALNGITAPRPPADLAGKRIMVRAEFKGEQTHGDLSRAVSRCG